MLLEAARPNLTYNHQFQVTSSKAAALERSERSPSQSPTSSPRLSESSNSSPTSSNPSSPRSGVPSRPATPTGQAEVVNRTKRAQAFTVPWIKFLSPSQNVGGTPEPAGDLRVGTKVYAVWEKDMWLAGTVVMSSNTRKGIRFGVSFPERDGTTLQLPRNKVKTEKEFKRASRVLSTVSSMDGEQMAALSRRLTQEMELIQEEGEEEVRAIAVCIVLIVLPRSAIPGLTGVGTRTIPPTATPLSTRRCLNPL